MARRRIKGLKCPRHGTKYLVTEDSIVYCGAPTPGEISDKCFYHPQTAYKKTDKKPREVFKSKNTGANAMKAMFEGVNFLGNKSKKKDKRGVVRYDKLNKSGFESMNRMLGSV